LAGRCHSCGREVSKDDILYEIKIEIYAKPGPIEISEEDLGRDYIGEIDRLIEEMGEMDTEELSDQVYECYQFDLCASCRQDLHGKLKLRSKQK
jgi:hypothetical protein